MRPSRKSDPARVCSSDLGAQRWQAGIGQPGVDRGGGGWVVVPELETLPLAKGFRVRFGKGRVRIVEQQRGIGKADKKSTRAGLLVEQCRVCKQCGESLNRLPGREFAALRQPLPFQRTVLFEQPGAQPCHCQRGQTEHKGQCHNQAAPRHSSR